LLQIEQLLKVEQPLDRLKLDRVGFGAAHVRTRLEGEAFLFVSRSLALDELSGRPLEAVLVGHREGGRTGPEQAHDVVAQTRNEPGRAVDPPVAVASGQRGGGRIDAAGRAALFGLRTRPEEEVPRVARERARDGTLRADPLAVEVELHLLEQLAG